MSSEGREHVPIPPPDSGRPTLVGSRYMVVTGHALVSQAAARILERGGNAVDAGVTAAIASCVVQPDMCNVGGIAPMAIRSPGDRTVETVSGVGVWGREVNLNAFERRFGDRMDEGAAAWIVPAAPDAWVTALRRHGTIGFAEAAEPAIELAMNGFPLDPRAATVLGVMGRRGLRRWPATLAAYWPDGREPRTGDVLRQPLIGGLLEALAGAGRGQDREAALDSTRAAFYEGEPAQRMVDFCRSLGGWLTTADFLDFRCEVERATALRVGEWTVHITGPWSQGPALLQALAVVEGLDLHAIGHNSAAYIHSLVETIKLVFADRERYYGDPRFVEVPLDRLLSSQHAAELRARIGPMAWRPDSETPRLATRPCDTTYIGIVDQHGGAFSCAPSDTLEAAPLVPGLGIMVSPRGVQSRLDPAHPSVLAAGKRPRITPCPAIALRDDGEGGEPMVCALGAPGGDQIVQAVLQGWLNLTRFRMTPQQATEAPRCASFASNSSFFPWRSIPGLLGLEGRLPPAVGADLTRRGHQVVTMPDFEFENAAFCLAGDLLPRDPTSGTRVLAAGADPRRSCYVVGR